jgi:hypothetical protein
MNTSCGVWTNFAENVDFGKVCPDPAPPESPTFLQYLRLQTEKMMEKLPTRFSVRYVASSYRLKKFMLFSFRNLRFTGIAAVFRGVPQRV